MKTNMIIFSTILIFLSSCNSKQEEPLAEKMLAVADESISQIKMPPPILVNSEASLEQVGSNAQLITAQAAVNKQKIIKDGNITVKSQNIGHSKKAIDQSLKKLSGYYESEDLQNNEQSIAYNLKIRIPAANFERLIASLESGKDEIEAKNIQARDVTEEYVDIETRLTTKRQYLHRYKQILAKAATVKDILAIEENIRTLEEEIDSQQGRLKYLADQVAFSTLNINLYKQKEYIERPKNGFLTRAKVALNQGWQSITGFVLWTVSIWHYLIILFVGILIIKRMISIRRNKN